MPQLTGKAIEASEGEFTLQNLEGVTWNVREEDWGRVEPGDVVTIDVPGMAYPLVSPEQITEDDRNNFRIVRIAKGGNPAFQG